MAYISIDSTPDCQWTPHHCLFPALFTQESPSHRIMIHCVGDIHICAKQMLSNNSASFCYYAKLRYTVAHGWDICFHWANITQWTYSIKNIDCYIQRDNHTSLMNIQKHNHIINRRSVFKNIHDTQPMALMNSKSYHVSPVCSAHNIMFYWIVLIWLSCWPIWHSIAGIRCGHMTWRVYILSIIVKNDGVQWVTKAQQCSGFYTD